MADYGVKLGSMLLTVVDPNRGHEVAYNRWYERDHFYAGCLVGPWLFAGRRWVAPRALKQLRFPAAPLVAGPAPGAGSYVATYWIHAEKFDEHRAWANAQVFELYKAGRGFAERTHVHTLMYHFDWAHYRDADPVPVELALDHGYRGLVTLALLREPGVAQAQLDDWLRTERLAAFMAGTPIATCATWSPVPQNPNAPMDIPLVRHTDRLDLQMWFLDQDPLTVWTRFEAFGRQVEAAGLARVAWASPWLPTVVGSDRYTDQLW
ncbi:hypothetical protein KF840_14810 [bacterium]|nr:hypothetical protein [bacterium]